MIRGMRWEDAQRILTLAVAVEISRCHSHSVKQLGMKGCWCVPLAYGACSNDQRQMGALAVIPCPYLLEVARKSPLCVLKSCLGALSTDS